MCAGCGGIFLSRRISEGDLLGTSRRFFIAYQMWVILMVLIVLAVLGLTAYALGALNADPSSTELGWRNNVQLDPEVNCRVTLDPEYQCAGYYGNECNGGNSTATNTWCAGHFCAIYCRVKDPNGPNPSESCKICVEQQKTYGQFGSCFNREVEFTAKGCQESYNEEVRSMYTIALIFSVLASASQVRDFYHDRRTKNSRDPSRLYSPHSFHYTDVFSCLYYLENPSTARTDHSDRHYLSPHLFLLSK